MLRKLGIEPGERRLFAWGAIALFLVGWADVSTKNVAEVFFVKRVGVELMPLAFLASSLLLVVTTWVVGRLAARRDRIRLLPGVLAVLGLLPIPLWLLVRFDLDSVFALLLVASKQITSIALLVFWIALGDLLNSRQTKRLFAPMMAGVTLGTILGSFASKPLGEWLGIAGLLPVAAGAMMLGGAAAWRLGHQRPRFERMRGVPPRSARATDAGDEDTPTVLSLWRDSVLFRLLLISTLCSGLLGPMLYFQFQYVADLATTGHGGEDKLLAFYAQFRGWIYGAVLVMQLVGSGGLYRRVGLPLAVALSPLAYLLGFLGLSVRLSLPAGVAAMAGTKVQDEAVYDPALRVLYSLFPDDVRARASALLEGPVKRGGGGVGNAAVVAALALGSARSVGYLALPIALVWLLAAHLLWRRYPQLLLGAVGARRARCEALENSLLDGTTVRALVPEMCGHDGDRARLAIELVGEASPKIAVSALAEALARAPAANRAWIVAALDDCLERTLTDSFESVEAAQRLEEVLRSGAAGLGDRERADLFRAYGRLQPGASAQALLADAARDSSPAVRLAVRADLERRGVAPKDDGALDAALAEGLRGRDPAARRAARKELRALLLRHPVDARWDARLEMLAGTFADGIDRPEAGDVLAAIATRHHARVARAGRRVLEARDDPDPRVRATLLRWAGYAGQHDQLAWLIDHLASDDRDCAVAAREAVSALGSIGSNVLLRELSYGSRSKREAIIDVMRGLDLRPEELRELYDLELRAVARDLRSLAVLKDRAPLALLCQRLTERVHEALHTALLFLAAIEDEDRIAELGERLWEMKEDPRQRAIVLEALEAQLPPPERMRLLPLLEGADLPTPSRPNSTGSEDIERALRALAEDDENLTRTISRGLLAAAGRPVEEHDAVNVVETMAHLKKISLFADLTARQLMELARAAKESRLGPAVTVVRQGQYDDCLYLVTEGVVHVRRGDTLLAELGPGEFFGEIALLEGVPRSADAVTHTRVRLLRLERSDLMERIDENPGIAVGMLRCMARRVRELTNRLVD
jgi:ATP/ADP translocase